MVGSWLIGRIGWSACSGSMVLLLCVAGCTQTVYELELRPDGDSIHRTLTFKDNVPVAPEQKAKKQQPATSDVETFSAEEQRIAELYNAVAERDEDGHWKFSGTFQGVMPQDVGGFGRYQRWQTSLGDLFVYSERFRGNDNLLGLMQDHDAEIDQLIELLAGWAESEIDDADLARRVVTLLRDEVRRDLKNLFLHVAARMDSEGSERSGIAASMSVLQYLLERDYFDIQDAPRLSRLMSFEDKAVLTLLREALVRKLKLQPESLELASLEKLKSVTDTRTSLASYLRTTDWYQQSLNSWRKDRTNDKEEDEPKPLDQFHQLVWRIVFPGLDEGNVVVDVSLACGQQPIRTNGKWDQQSLSVSWRRGVHKKSIPMQLFAIWSQPDEGVQRERFGFKALSGKDLEDYVMWYHGLGDDEASHWDTFLAGLDPSDRLEKKLEAFEFPGDDDLANVPRELLKSAIAERP